MKNEINELINRYVTLHNKALKRGYTEKLIEYTSKIDVLKELLTLIK